MPGRQPLHRFLINQRQRFARHDLTKLLESGGRRQRGIEPKKTRIENGLGGAPGWVINRSVFWLSIRFPIIEQHDAIESSNVTGFECPEQSRADGSLAIQSPFSYLSCLPCNSFRSSRDITVFAGK